jgi:hypothetical protein
MRLGVTVLLALLAGGCRERDLDWDIRFEPPGLQAATVRLDARIVEGDCGMGGDVLWRATLRPRGTVEAPPSLSGGDYCFEALAGDAACEWFATGALDVELPKSDGASLTVVVRASSPTSNCAGACMAGTCAGGGDADAGGVIDRTCIDGGCAQTCASDCSAECVGGDCAQRCGAGASCSFDCIDTCTVECLAGSTCAASCVEGCTMTCRDGATCNFDCLAGGCTFACEDGAECRTTCLTGDCTGP